MSLAEHGPKHGSRHGHLNIVQNGPIGPRLYLLVNDHAPTQPKQRGTIKVRKRPKFIPRKESFHAGVFFFFKSL